MTTPATLVPTISTLADGTRIPYVERGEPDGPAVVLLHGFTDSWRSWQPILDRLRDSIHVLAPTLRGHGDASRPSSGYGITELADDVVATTNDAGLDRFIVVGHSLGASVAAAVAVRHRQRVAGLVLVGAFATPATNPGVAELAAAIDDLADPVERDFVEAFQASTLANPVAHEFLQTVISESCKLPVHVWKAALDGFLAHDHVGELATIAAPTRVIWGEHDAFVPRDDQDRLIDHIPHSELVVYAGTGHAVHWEHPDAFATDLGRFVDTSS